MAVRRSGVTGDKALVAALRELAKGVSPAEIDRGAQAAMKPMLEDATLAVRANRNFAGKYPGFPDPKVPRKGGHVDQGLVVKLTDGATKEKREYKLGATRRSRYLIHLLEFGTAPHYQPNFKGGFFHPGATPKPAMGPAFERFKDNVPDLFGQYLWNSLSARAAQLNRKSKR